MRALRLTSALLAMGLLLGGCGAAVQLGFEDYFSPSTDILPIMEDEAIRGKTFTSFATYYYYRKNGENVLAFLFPIQRSLDLIELHLENAEEGDLTKLHNLIHPYLASRYADRYSFRIYELEKADYDGNRKRWMKEKIIAYKDRDYRDKRVEGTSISWREKTSEITILLRCPMPCDRELLELIFEKAAIAPFTPQAKRGYEILKSRLNSQ